MTWLVAFFHAYVGAPDESDGNVVGRRHMYGSLSRGHTPTCLAFSAAIWPSYRGKIGCASYVAAYSEGGIERPAVRSYVVGRRHVAFVVPQVKSWPSNGAISPTDVPARSSRPYGHKAGLEVIS